MSFVNYAQLIKSLCIECIETFNPFNSPYDVSGDFKQLYRELKDFPKPDLYQVTIRKLCNKAKHFKINKIEQQDKNYTAICGGVNMQCGNPNAACGAFDHYLYYVEIEGKDINLSNILSAQIEKWTAFIENGV